MLTFTGVGGTVGMDSGDCVQGQCAAFGDIEEELNEVLWKSVESSYRALLWILVKLHFCINI